MDLAIAVGFDEVSLTEISTYFSETVPEQRTRPFPAVRVLPLSGKPRQVGNQIISLFIAGCDFADLDTFVTAIFGDWTTYNAEVTLYARDVDNTLTSFNAIAELPIAGTNFNFVWPHQIENLTLNFGVVT